MKTVCVLMVSAVSVSLSAYALKGGAFRSLGDMASCDNLLIVQVPPSYQGHPPPYESATPTVAYDVEVLKDLRGKLSAGSQVTVSVRKILTPGSRYLLAGKPASRGGVPWSLFHWELGVVEIPANFNLSGLDGMDIPAQLSTLLSARRDEVERQLSELRDEEESIGKLLPAKVANNPLPEEWKTVDVRGAFSFVAPPAILGKPVQGIDSQVGQYEIGDMELTYDYGAFSSTLEEFGSDKGYARRKVTVDGWPAELVTTDAGKMGIFFPRVPSGSRLTLYIRFTQGESRDIARKILMSVKFKQGR